MSVSSDQIPIWIVRGSNWTSEVKLNEDDYLDEQGKEVSLLQQAIEAGSKSIERIFPLWRPEPEDSSVNREFGIDNGVIFQMLDEQEPSCGSFMLAYIKGTDENHNTAQYFPSYLSFADGGYYELAHNLKEQYDKDMEQAEAALRDLEESNLNKPISKSKKSKTPKKPKKK